MRVLVSRRVGWHACAHGPGGRGQMTHVWTASRACLYPRLEKRRRASPQVQSFSPVPLLTTPRHDPSHPPLPTAAYAG